MDSLSLGIFIASLSAFLNGNQRWTGWLCAGLTGWPSVACVMNGLSAAAPMASSGPEIQELRTRIPRVVYLVPCLERHFAGTVPPVPGSARWGQCHESLLVHRGTVPSCWGQHCRLLGQGIEMSQRSLCSCDWASSALCGCVGSLPVWEVVTLSSFSACPSYWRCFMLSMSAPCLLSLVFSSSLLNHPTVPSDMPFPAPTYHTLLLCPTTSPLLFLSYLPRL